MTGRRRKRYAQRYASAIEVPALQQALGAAWPEFCAMVDRLRDLDEEAARAEGQRIAEEAMARWPAIRQTLRAALEGADLMPVRLGASPGPSPRPPRRPTKMADDVREETPIRKSEPPQEQPAPGAPGAVSEAVRVTRYADVSYPEDLKLRGRWEAITLTLTGAPSEPGASGFAVEPEVPLQVRLVAAGFEIKGGETRAVDVPAAADSPPVVFQIRAIAAGLQTLWIHIEQRGSPIVSLPIQILVKEEEAAAAPAHRSGPLNLAPSLNGPQNVLYVHPYRRDGSVYLHMLWVCDGTPLGGAADIEIGQEPEQYTAGLYADLVALQARRDPGSGVAATRAMIRAKLAEIGQTLWEKLLPPAIKRYCWAQRTALEGRSLMICTEEPYIPWELIWPWDDAGTSGEVASGPWCTTFSMARWYVSTGSDQISWRPTLPLGRAGLLRPSDARLVHAAAEEAEIRELLEGRRGKIVGPAGATFDLVRGFLAGEQYDWFHVASHGTRIEAGSASAVLVLENGQTLAPTAVTGAIAARIRTNHPGFVFNACDSGNQTFVLTGVGGWAQQLIKNGASLFLGTLWPVDDLQAKELCVAFYRGLLSGMPVGEALRQARRAALERNPGDITGLAYTLYAHPNAVVSLPPT